VRVLGKQPEEAGAPSETVKRRRSRPCKVAKTVPEPGPEGVALQPQAKQPDDQHLVQVEDVYDLLAEQSQMQCSVWERTQDADPVIKHT